MARQPMIQPQTKAMLVMENLLMVLWPVLGLFSLRMKHFQRTRLFTSDLDGKTEAFARDRLRVYHTSPNDDPVAKLEERPLASPIVPPFVGPLAISAQGPHRVSQFTNHIGSGFTDQATQPGVVA